MCVWVCAEHLCTPKSGACQGSQHPCPRAAGQRQPCECPLLHACLLPPGAEQGQPHLVGSWEAGARRPLWAGTHLGGPDTPGSQVRENRRLLPLCRRRPQVLDRLFHQQAGPQTLRALQLQLPAGGECRGCRGGGSGARDPNTPPAPPQMCNQLEALVGDPANSGPYGTGQSDTLSECHPHSRWGRQSLLPLGDPLIQGARKISSVPFPPQTLPTQTRPWPCSSITTLSVAPPSSMWPMTMPGSCQLAGRTARWTGAGILWACPVTVGVVWGRGLLVGGAWTDQ